MTGKPGSTTETKSRALDRRAGRVAWGPPLVLTLIVLMRLPEAAPRPPWGVYTFQAGSFVSLPVDPFLSASGPAHATALPPLPPIPTDWEVTAAVVSQVTQDGTPEWALLVWRPWRDWPIQEWLAVPSPIRAFHDEDGRSCHLILLEPTSGRQVWAGSALPLPLLALAVGDVDGDGQNEVVTLEGEYRTGRRGPARHVDVWRWDGFGFTLQWRSAPGWFHFLGLTDANDDGILDIAVR